MKIREKCELVTVNAGENLAKLRAKGFVRPKKHSILLPYFDELEKKADENLQQALNGLYVCFATDNYIEGKGYAENFKEYLNHFGLRMSKETFFNLIRFFHAAICREHQRLELLKCAIDCLTKMLNLSEVLLYGWKDLTLEWRQLFDIYLKCSQNKVYPDEFYLLNTVVYKLARFYDPKEHGAIWEACLHLYSYGSHSSMTEFMSTCSSFLTIQGMSGEEVKEHAVNTWIKKLWELYQDAEMNTMWQIVCIDHITTVSKMAPQAMDLSTMYDILYTKLMRGFLLTIRDGKVPVGDGTENHTVAHLASICAFTIGGPNSSLSHFKRLIQYIHFNIYPTNSGAHDSTINEFISTFLILFHSRLYEERLAYVKRPVPKEYYLTDADIDSVTEALVDVAIMMMYSANFSSDFKIIYNLNAINRELVTPKLLDHFYSSISAVNEPQRLSITIESFSTVIFDMIRSPTPEYRASRDITYDSHWLKMMEDERVNWPTFKLGSELHQVSTHRFTSLRAHAFYIMEILVNQINVNDVDRTASALKTLTVLFSSFPLMDFSAATKFHGAKMSEDDKILCVLSKRVPRLVQFALERMLEVISCFSISPPKTSSATAGASMSTESHKNEGDEEAVLKSGIQKCATVMFERVDEKLKDTLYAILFDYVRSSEFATYMATDLLSTLVSAAAWRCRTFYRKLAELLVKRLKELLTEDVRKNKNAPSTLIYNAVLARALFMVQPGMILEHEQLLCEITDLLLSSECKLINRIATEGIHAMFYVVLQTNTEEKESPENLTFAKPLNEWNPIREWARCNDYNETVIKWYIPGIPQVEFAQRIADRYLFPVIEQVQPGKLDRDQLRRAVHHVSTVIFGLENKVRHPASAVPVDDIYTPFYLPIPQYDLGNVCSLEFEFEGPHGENTRELLVKMVERMIGNTQDPKALSSLASIAHWCFGRPLVTNFPELETFLSEEYRVLKDSTYCSIRKASQHTMDEMAYLKHLSILCYHQTQLRQPNTFDQRIINCLVELSMNDYVKVRETASTLLYSNSDQIYRCRDMVIPQICKVLTDETLKNTDRITGAINLMTEMGLWESTNPMIRILIWDAILRMKVHDDVTIRMLFDELPLYVKASPRTPIVQLGTPATHLERNERVYETGAKLVQVPGARTEAWAKFLTDESIMKQTIDWHVFEDILHTCRLQLVDKLYTFHIRNPELHHTRQKLAKTMTYNVQRETSDENTIRLLIGQMLDDDAKQRTEARKWLVYWMKKNKPKTVRVDVPAPKRTGTEKMESGIREDNMWIVYDSENLPNTEQKWNEMLFVEKEQGACRWKSTTSVVRKRADGPALNAKPLTVSDKAIIEFFSNQTSVKSFIDLRVIDKDSESRNCNDTFDIIKYIIRNYPNAAKPLELFYAHLKRFLDSKERNEQMCGAELFIGIVHGLKHHPFSVLDAFWKDITVHLDKFFNYMNDEAEGTWREAISNVLNVHSDLRRHWWLVESLMDGAKRSAASSECQQAFRLSNLIFKKWRYAEIVNRLCDIAWNKLPVALTDSLRYKVARIFHTAGSIREMISTATLVNIPERFVPKSFDQIIEAFILEIPQLTMDTKEQAQSSRSDPTFVTATPKRKRVSTDRRSLGSPTAKRTKRSSSSSVSSMDSDYDSEERKIMTYFRTLLEFVLQYYELSMHSYTPALVRILPKLMEFANEDNYDMSEEVFRDVDISQLCAMIVHDYMSGAWINEKFVEEMMKSWKTAYENSKQKQRVRISVVKFIQAAVYSNMFSMNRASRQKHVEDLLFQAIVDQSIEIRREASKCLLLFIHCDYLRLTDAQIDVFAKDLDLNPRSQNQKTDKRTDSVVEARMHGAVLVLGAIALAFPFSLPVDKILKPLRILNAKSARRPIVQRAVTEILREFRRQHRDDWQKAKIALGDTLAFDIASATAPAYYA